jgi:hypothetical protein
MGRDDCFYPRSVQLGKHGIKGSERSGVVRPDCVLVIRSGLGV